MDTKAHTRIDRAEAERQEKYNRLFCEYVEALFQVENAIVELHFAREAMREARAAWQETPQPQIGISGNPAIDAAD
jgi:outer membrane protein TolC